MNEELKSYITAHREHGKSDQEIKETLIAHGYTAEQADTALHHGHHAALHSASKPTHKQSGGMRAWQINLIIIIGGILIATFIPALVLPITLLSAYWVHEDAKKIEISKYKTTVYTPSTTPRGAAFMVFFFWIFTLPLYMTFRERVREGKIPLKHNV